MTYANFTLKFYKILLFEREEERTRGLVDERMRGKGRLGGTFGENGEDEDLWARRRCPQGEVARRGGARQGKARRDSAEK